MGSVSQVPRRREDSIPHYVKYLERVAKSNGCSDAQAAQIFPGLLEVGSAALDDLDQAKLQSYEAIKATAGTDGYKHILVLMDSISKWAEVKPVSRLGGGVFVQWLRFDVIPRFGVPRHVTLVMDRG